MNCIPHFSTVALVLLLAAALMDRLLDHGARLVRRFFKQGD